MCGENAPPDSVHAACPGSSPRVRGKPLVAAPAPHRPRLIPACAGKTPWRSAPPSRGRAHPRVCGENHGKTPRTMCMGGSSPRVRGKPSERTSSRISARLIPACAGKTPTSPTNSAAAAAHPRVCGENVVVRSIAPRAIGSSPRVRGKPFPFLFAENVIGLIPACAGKTISSAVANPHCTAHPRVCGENLPSPTRSCGLTGSSPRVRGKQGATYRYSEGTGLIPACAGKTRVLMLTPLRQPAHPRVCGENPAAPGGFQCLRGSSPRVRGKRCPLASWVSPARLIPACAGKTRPLGYPSDPLGAHPRVCGENKMRSMPITNYDGSSPRVRGKLEAPIDPFGPDRLIPACAGKTSALSPTRIPRRAHPRVCGENTAHRRPCASHSGSSPRVRGKLPRARFGRGADGLIPACAGKTGEAPTRGGGPRAHPRVCGENNTAEVCSLGRGGSSPRVRGKRP